MNREEALMILLDHRIEVVEGCEFGDHWYCSCGKEGLDSSMYHILDVLFPEKENLD